MTNRAKGNKPTTGADHAGRDSLPVRVMIADDQPLVRQALSELLGKVPGLTVIDGAADGEEAVQRARAFRPDVVLMDLQMPRLDGIGATRRILSEFPAIKIVVLTTFDTDEKVFAAISAGASGYLLKDAAIDEIAEAIHAVMRNEPRLSPEIARKIMGEFRRLRPHPDTVSSASAPHDALTERENVILDLIARGRSNAEIATTLGLAEGTVKNYVSRILEKVHVKNRTELATRAVRGEL
jgi:DNA-binding NarL/FixJ family response regulator